MSRQKRVTFKLRFRFRLATRRARTSSSACPPTWLRNWNFICNCEYYLKKPLDEYESLMLELDIPGGTAAAGIKLGDSDGGEEEEAEPQVRVGDL